MTTVKTELFDSIEKDLSSIVDYSIDMLNITIAPHEFTPSAELKKRIIIFLYESCRHDLILDKKNSSEPLRNHILSLSLKSTQFIKTSPEFQKSERRYLEQELDKKIAYRKEKNNLLSFPKPNSPSSCPALQDWPDKRQASPISKTRLENAGDFMTRLFESRLYDKKIYGEIFMPDIKKANPRLYYALDKYQKRNGKNIVGYLSERVEDVTRKVEEGSLTDLKSRTIATNKRYRSKTN